MILAYACTAFALNYEDKTPTLEDGSPLTLGKLKILSVYRLFTTTLNNLEMVELSGLAWSEDENLLYAVSDHGDLFHFRPEFNEHGLADIELINAHALRDESNESLGFPNSDSEGLALRNGNNGRQGDDELLISFELRPRLQWHRPDGSFIRKEKLPEVMQQRSSYASWSKALESVVIHPVHGVLTSPEFPMGDHDWSSIMLYGVKGKNYEIPVGNNEKMAVCAIEVMPDGDLLVLQRKYRFFAPTWTSALLRLSLEDRTSSTLAHMQLGGRMPMDNYEGLAHHQGNRYFMISDNNESFAQQTLLVYFEILP